MLLCEQRGCGLEDLSLEDFKAESELFEADIVESLDAESIADARVTEGGTGRMAIKEQLAMVEQGLARDKEQL